MESQIYTGTVVADASPADRSAFLRSVIARTLGGLFITAIVSVLSTLFIAPMVLDTNRWLALGVIYGSFFGAQIVGRKLVYGDAKAAGLVLGAMMQGIALGFLLLVAMVTSAPGEGLQLIAYALLMVLLSTAAMLIYVTAERREFSMIRAGLTMLGIPMLVLMGLQVVFPMNGMAGVLVSGLFLCVSVGALLYKLNTIVHDFPVTAATEAAFELTISIVVFFWNLLSFILRMRRR